MFLSLSFALVGPSSSPPPSFSCSLYFVLSFSLSFSPSPLLSFLCSLFLSAIRVCYHTRGWACHYALILLVHKGTREVCVFSNNIQMYFSLPLALSLLLSLSMIMTYIVFTIPYNSRYIRARVRCVYTCLCLALSLSMFMSYCSWLMHTTRFYITARVR